MEFQKFEESFNSIVEKYFSENRKSMREFYINQEKAIDEGLELIFSELRSYLNSEDSDSYHDEANNSNSDLEIQSDAESDSGVLKTEIPLIVVTDVEQRTKGHQKLQKQVLLILESQKLELSFEECVPGQWEGIIWNPNLSPPVFDTGQINQQIDKKLDNLGHHFQFDDVDISALIDIYTRCRDVENGNSMLTEGEYEFTSILNVATRSKIFDVFRMLLDFCVLRQEVDKDQNQIRGRHSNFWQEMMNIVIHVVGEINRISQLSKEIEGALEVESMQSNVNMTKHLATLQFEVSKKIVSKEWWEKYVVENGFYIVGTCTDSPCIKLKIIFKVTRSGKMEVRVQPYEGWLFETWIDCDFTVGGQVILREENYGLISYLDKLIGVMAIHSVLLVLVANQLGCELDNIYEMELQFWTRLLLKSLASTAKNNFSFYASEDMLDVLKKRGKRAATKVLIFWSGRRCERAAEEFSFAAGAAGEFSFAAGKFSYDVP